MKRKVFKSLAVVISVASLLLSGCGSSETTSDKGEYDGLVLRVAMGATSTYRLETTEELKYLEEEFGKDGISIDYIEIANGPAFVDAVASDQVDLGIFGDQPLIAGNVSGKPVEIIASFSHDDGNINLVASPESNIKTPGDLRGKTVSFAAGTTEEKTIRLILETEGISEEEVTLVNLSDADAKVALGSGDVDAHVFFGQIGIGLVNDGYTLVTNIGAYAHDVQIIAANKNFVEKYPQLAARFLQVVDKTNQWIADNRDEAVKLIAELRQLDYNVANQYYDLEDRKIGYTEEDEKALNITAKFLFDSGLTERLFTADDFVDTTYLKLAGLAQ